MLTYTYKNIEEKSNKIGLFTESFHWVKGNNKTFYEDGLGVVLLNFLGNIGIRPLKRQSMIVLVEVNIVRYL